jgi:hypothetical protein
MTDVDRQQQEARLRLWLRSEIARAGDELAAEPFIAERAGQMAEAEKLERTQIRNLENLAYTTDKLSGLTDFLKRQVGRDSRRRSWGHLRLGEALIEHIRDQNSRAKEIVERIPEDLRAAIDPDLPRRVQLDLCRELVRHLAAEFDYVQRTREG